MRPLDYKLILTVVLSIMVSLNLSSHSGKNKMIDTSTKAIYSPVDEPACDDENAAILGNLVWEDMNGDGVQNLGEPGIGKVIVKLFDDNHILQDIKMTNQKGFFQFKNLRAGDYMVEFEKPDGYEFTFSSLDDSVNSDSDVTWHKNQSIAITETIHLAAGQKNLSVDAGMFKCIPLGKMVWFDLNRNNVKDLEESGINGLSVKVFRMENEIWTEWEEVFTGNTSDASANEGLFRTCVPPGEYFLKFDMPLESFGNVEPFAGDIFTDSDVTSANGINTTDAFRVKSGEERLDIGAGYFSMESVAQARLVKQTQAIDEKDESNSPTDKMLIEVYDRDNNLVASARGSEKEKLNLKQFEAEGYYIRFVPMSLKKLSAHYAKPASLKEDK